MAGPHPRERRNTSAGGRTPRPGLFSGLSTHGGPAGVDEQNGVQAGDGEGPGDGRAHVHQAERPAGLPHLSVEGVHGPQLPAPDERHPGEVEDQLPGGRPGGQPVGRGPELAGADDDSAVGEVTARSPLRVAVTGIEGAEGQSKEQGFHHHFQKPVPPGELAGVLADHARRLGPGRAGPP
jgi:hypothetical protein